MADSEGMRRLAPDACQPAYDAVYALIRALGESLPSDPVHRNALIWRGVQTALDALDAAGLLLTDERRREIALGALSLAADSIAAGLADPWLSPISPLYRRGWADAIETIRTSAAELDGKESRDGQA